MPQETRIPTDTLRGHALRNANLCRRALERARQAAPLAAEVVRIRAGILRLTRLECARRSGISRGALRDLELGIHHPTRQTLRHFLDFCQKQRVQDECLEGLRQLYAGVCDTLENLLARLELKAGSTRELARRVGISATTLWEYRRGHFPLPHNLMLKLCRCVGENEATGERLWFQTEMARRLQRGHPEGWALLGAYVARAGEVESHLLRLGVTNTAFRRLRYLELPPWQLVAKAAGQLCTPAELQNLQRVWEKSYRLQKSQDREGFGYYLKRHRMERNLERRTLADLCGVGGKKPARIIKHVEEDGLYSSKAFPAGLVALVTDDAREQTRMLELWKGRRRQFLLRRRPETRLELRLARELYGLPLSDMLSILGYSSQEYQRLERGVTPLSETAQARVLAAFHQAGQRQIQALLQRRDQRAADLVAWRTPSSVPQLIERLAARDGGLLPLARLVKRAGVHGLGAVKLRAIVQERETPAWPLIRQLAEACGVTELTDVREDWCLRYRARLQESALSPLAIELRLAIAESANTLRELSPRLGFNYSVLVREFQRIDHDEPIKWFHVERLLRVLGISPESERWRVIRALWATAGARRKRPATLNGHSH